MAIPWKTIATFGINNLPKVVEAIRNKKNKKRGQREGRQAAAYQAAAYRNLLSEIKRQEIISKADMLNMISNRIAVCNGGGVYP